MNIFSNRLKEAMKFANYKAVDIHKKTGIGKSSISDWLSGKYEPKQDKIYLMANALGVNPAWLMGFDAPMIDDNTDEDVQASKPTPNPDWQPEITPKDERDIAKQLEGMLNAMGGNSFAAYGNSPIDELDEDDYELLRASLESTLRTAKLLAKKRYTPNKYKVTDKKDDVDGR